MGADCAELIAEQVRGAGAAGSRLAIRGAGSKPWLAEAAGGALDTRAHAGIVSYQSDELVVVVRAGTSLVALDQVLSEQGQMLAAEPPSFGDRSTVGGALALGWSGSRRPFAGSLRDAVLGVRMVNGLGEVLSFGGQVMKNVAGFDVPRLLSGSLGRCGVILDVSLRVVPRPRAELTLCLEGTTADAARQQVRAAIMAGQPITAASRCGSTLRVRLSGHESTLGQLAGEWGAEQEDGEYWSRLRRLDSSIAAAETTLGDWNGNLVWGLQDGQFTFRQLQGQRAVSLAAGPGEADMAPERAALLQRVQQAFDPLGVFSASQPAAAVTA